MRSGGDVFDVSEAERLYVAGWSCSQIADRFDCSSGYVAARLRRHGVAMRPTGRRLNEAVDTAEVIRLRKQGASFREIARAVGLSVSGARGRYLVATGEPDEQPRPVTAAGSSPDPERSTGRPPVPAGS